jgi:hypothetical protein
MGAKGLFYKRPFSIPEKGAEKSPLALTLFSYYFPPLLRVVVSCDSVL